MHNKVQTHWIGFPFFILVNPKEVQNNDLDKIDELGWFTIKNLPSPLHSGLKKGLDIYRKYFNEFSAR